jgi:hypothetical protein
MSISFREIPPSRKQLKLTGDMLATIMGWLEDVGAGGGTAFTHWEVEKVKLMRFVSHFSLS